MQCYQVSLQIFVSVFSVNNFKITNVKDSVYYRRPKQKLCAMKTEKQDENYTVT
jgi:hypothetical protein